MSEEVNKTKTAIYPFNQIFQRKLLKLCVTDPSFLKYNIEVIKPHYFTSEHMRIIASNIIGCYQRNYNSALTIDHVQNQLVWIASKQGWSDDFKQEVINEFVEIVSVPVTDEIDYIKEKITDFCKYHEFRKALSYAIDTLETGEAENYEKAVSMINKSLRLGSGSVSSGINILQSVKSVETMKEIVSNSSFNTDRQIQTPWEGINLCMQNGLGRGEIGLMLGSQKFGKTTVALNLLTGAGRQNLNGLYITFEIREAMAWVRLLSHMTGLPQYKILNAEKHQKEITEILESQYHPQLHTAVKYFNPKSLTIGQLRSFLSRYEDMYEVDLDLLVLDYTARMKRADGLNSYEGLGDIYEGLVAIGNDFDLGIWDFAQVGRLEEGQSPSSQLVRESIKLVDESTFIVDITRPERNRLGMYVEMARRGIDGVTVNFDIDWNTYTISETSNTFYAVAGDNQPEETEVDNTNSVS